MTSQNFLNVKNGIVHLQNENDLLSLNIFDELKRRINANEIFHITGIDLYHSNGHDADVKRKKSELRDLLSNNVRIHPSDFTHCLLSNCVYKGNLDPNKSIAEQFDKCFDSSDDFKDNQEACKLAKTILSDWKIHHQTNNQQKGYFGCIYINEKYKQIVLAHRGTDDLWDIKTDVEEIILGNIIRDQSQKAYEMVHEAVKLVKKKNNYALSFTGHSLGAFLAELSLYFCFTDFNYKQAKTVNFDSPGSKLHLEKLNNSHVSNPYIESLSHIKFLNTVTYLSNVNIVNICNEHVGLVFRIYPKLDECKGGGSIKKIIQKILPESHSLKYFIRQFDAETEKPKKYKLVRNWPRLKSDEIIDAVSNFEIASIYTLTGILKNLKNIYNIYNCAKSNEFLNYISISDDVERLDDGLIEFNAIETVKIRYLKNYHVIDFKENSSKLIADYTIDSFLEKLFYKDLSGSTTNMMTSLRDIKKLYKIDIRVENRLNEKEIQINSNKCVISIEKLKDLFMRILLNDSKNISFLLNENRYNSVVPWLR